MSGEKIRRHLRRRAETIKGLANASWRKRLRLLAVQWNTKV